MKLLKSISHVAQRLPGIPRVPQGPVNGLAKGLGAFSIGLGLAELIMPKILGGALGSKDSVKLVRGYGAREVASGVGILASSNPLPWLWGRVAGDALDLGTLARYPQKGGSRQRRNVKLAMAAVAGVTLLDIACASCMKRS